MKKILFIGNSNSIHDVKWIEYLNRYHNLQAFISSNKDLSLEDENYFKLRGIQIVPRLNNFSLLNWFSNYKIYKLLKKIIIDFNIDCIHVFVGTSQVIIPSLLKLPVVLTTRGTDVNFTLFQLSKSKDFKNKFLFNLLSKAYKRIDQITCTSETQIKVLKSIIPNLNHTPALIRTGVDLESVVNSPMRKLNLDHERENVVLFIRNIHENYDPLLSVAGVVKMKLEIRNKTHFIFMMGRDYTVFLFEKMKVILEKNNISHSFIGPITNQEVWQFIKVADLVVMNPLSDGTPNSAIEAMGAKKKLIMGYCDYDKDLFNDQTTIFLSKRDSSELAEKMSYQLSNNNEELLKKAFDVVWEKGRQSIEMQKVLDLYTSLLD